MGEKKKCLKYIFRSCDLNDNLRFLSDAGIRGPIVGSILTDNAKRAIQGNLEMHVTQPGGQICN